MKGDRREGLKSGVISIIILRSGVQIPLPLPISKTNDCQASLDFTIINILITANIEVIFISFFIELYVINDSI